MTPEQIEIVRKYAEAWSDDEGLALRALLAEWEERGRALDRAAIARGEAESLIEERGRKIARLKHDMVTLTDNLHARYRKREAEIRRLKELTGVEEKLRRRAEWAEARLAKVVEAAGEPCPILGTASPEFVWERAMSFVLAAAQPKEEP